MLYVLLTLIVLLVTGAIGLILVLNHFARRAETKPEHRLDKQPIDTSE